MSGLAKGVDLLSYSDKYDIEPAKAYAINLIDNLTPPLRSSELFRMSKLYHVESWFIPSLRRLVHTPFNQYTAEDYKFLSPELLPKLFALKGSVDQEYKELLVNEYAGMDHNCGFQNQVDCQRNFNRFLRDIIANLLHPDDPYTPDIAEHVLLQRTQHLADGHCYRRAALKIKEDRFLQGSKAVLKEGMIEFAKDFGLPGSIVPEDLDFGNTAAELEAANADNMQ